MIKASKLSKQWIVHAVALSGLFCATLFAPIDQAAAQYRKAPSRYAADNAVRIRGGVFTPDGESEYWQDLELDFTGSVEDFEDLAVGFDYIRYLSPRLGLLVGAQVYEGESEQAYLDFVDDDGFDILHRTALEVSSIDLGFIYHLADRRSTVSPYIGGGGTLFAYTLTEDGDFIDFAPADPEIFNAFFETDGNSVGAFVLAGLEFPLGDSLSLFAEGRWQFGDDSLDGDFEGFGDLDLSSTNYGAGLSWRF